MSKAKQQVLPPATIIKNNISAFSTKRFIISQLVEEDKQLICSLYTNKQIMLHISPALTPEKAEHSFDIMLRSMKKDVPRIIGWSITVKATGKKIGFQALSWRKWPQAKTDPLFQTGDQPEVGIMLTETAQGKGYAEEAMGALMEFAYKHLAIATIHLFYYQTHSVTKRFLKKLGCTLDMNNQPLDPLIEYQYVNQNHWRKNLIEKVAAPVEEANIK